MDDQGTVHVLSLGPYIEEQIANSLIQTEQGIQLVMDPHTANDMIMQISSTIESHPEIAGQPVLMTSPTARRHIAKLTHRFIPQLTVLAHTELASDVNVTSVGLVELSHAS